MAYITLNELKEVLPIILERWIDEDDESWEWIFQEIEQKCHIGTKCKGKKWKKRVEDNITEMTSMVDTHSTVLSAYRNDINDLQNRNTQLDLLIKDIRAEVRHLRADITAAKSMAETAKRRTEVDYTQMSKVKNDADVIQEVYNRMAGRGAMKEELDSFRNLIHKYDALEKKEVPVRLLTKMCETCKHDKGLRFDIPPCDECNLNDKWEAKDDGSKL